VNVFFMSSDLSVISVSSLEQIRWVKPKGTAVPGQAVTEVEKISSVPSFYKNRFNVLVLQCKTYQILRC
jgi:hypothetical protein